MGFALFTSSACVRAVGTTLAACRPPQKASYTVGFSWVTRQPTPAGTAAGPPLASLHWAGWSHLTPEDWSTPGFYGWGLVFQAVVSQEGTAQRTHSGHKGLAVLHVPCWARVGAMGLL